MVDLAFAAAQSPSGQGGGSAMVQVAFFAAIFAIFYFLLIRPQQKQRREREVMLGAIKKGDRVVTTSGLHGTVTGIDDSTVTLRVTDQVKLQFDKTAIGRIMDVSGAKDA
jgi:preprotein translocase subunit YajC